MPDNRDEVVYSSLEEAAERLSIPGDLPSLLEDGPDLTKPNSLSIQQKGNPTEDDVVLGASRRLRVAVDKLVVLLKQKIKEKQEDLPSMLRRNEELVQELRNEMKCREKILKDMEEFERQYNLRTHELEANLRKAAREKDEIAAALRSEKAKCDKLTQEVINANEKCKLLEDETLKLEEQVMPCIKAMRNVHATLNGSTPSKKGTSSLATSAERLRSFLSGLSPAELETHVRKVATEKEDIASALRVEKAKTEKLNQDVFSLEEKCKLLENENFRLEEQLIDYSEMKQQLMNASAASSRRGSRTEAASISIDSDSNDLTNTSDMVETLDTKLAQINAVMDKFIVKNEQLTKQLRDEREHKAALEHLVTKLEREREVMLAQITELKAQLKLKHEEAEQLRIKAKNSEDVNSKSSQREKHLEQELARAEQQILPLIETLRGVREDYENNERMHNELKAQLVIKENEIKDLNCNYRQLLAERDSLLNRVDSVTEELKLQQDLAAERLRAMQQSKVQKQLTNGNANFDANTNGGLNCDADVLRKLKRCQNQRRALIFQKKYLLSLLGGFQLTEKATLALVANMNVTLGRLLVRW